MRTEGIEAVYLTTHNWGRAAKFFQALGFNLEFETDHNSGQLRNGAVPTFSSLRSLRAKNPRRTSF
jgi:N-acetylglutamate synthase-like GNAT family acetyltransferase